MAGAHSERIRVLGYYAVWATICAAAGCIVVTLLHSWLFSYHAWLVEDLEAAGAIAAGQGVVVLVTGGVLARLGRGLEKTALLGVMIGLFDFAINLVWMVVPNTELGRAPDLLILAAAAAAATLYGSTKASAT
jgi:hypothetical protein